MADTPRRPSNGRPSRKKPASKPKPSARAARDESDSLPRGARAVRETRTFKLEDAVAMQRAENVAEAISGQDVDADESLMIGEMAAVDREATPWGPVRPTSTDPDFGGQVKGGFQMFWWQVKMLAKPATVTGGASITPLLVLFAANIFDGFDEQAYAILLPEIRDYFGLSLTALGVVGFLVGMFSVLFAVPIGFFQDRWKRTWMVGGGTAIWGFFSLMTGFAWNIPALACARFGGGVGKSLQSVHTNLLADYYPPEVRPATLAFHQLANRVAALSGPLIAGSLASWFFWQLPFFLYAIPAFVIASYAAVKLREPSRGEQERRAMGASEEVALQEDRPPSWSESFRITWSVRSLRRIYYAIPFLVGSQVVIAQLRSLYYFEVFGLTPAQRGIIATLDEPFGIAGLIVGGLFAARFMRYRPGRVITYAGALAMLNGVAVGLIAISPILPMAIAFSMVISFVTPIFFPALLAVLLSVIPARVRGFSNSLFTIFSLFGLVGLLFGAAIGDRYGLRAGMLVMVPIYWLGALLVSSAGLSVEADIRQAMAAAMAAHITRTSRDEGKAKLLVVRDLDVHYDQIQILFNVDFEVEDGELVALLGTNGAGKSTLLRAISGLTPASNGAIFMEGEDITYLPANEHAEKGIVFMPGGRSLFPTLTIGENLRLASWMYRDDEDYVSAAIERVLEYFPILRERWNENAGNLSGGEQQMLGLGQAFLSRPKLLMIDELSLGLAPTIVEQLLRIVRAIHEQGTTIILVEQSVNVALTLAKRAVFMEKGEVRFSGPTSELLQRGDILRSVFLRGSSAAAGSLGGSGSAYRQGGKQKTGYEEKKEVVLDVREISKRFGGITALNGISFTLEENTILGVIGPNGAGKTTLFDAISGFITPDRGRVILLGEDITDLGPDPRAKVGLQRSFQDARLFPALTVRENIAVALEQHVEVRSTAMAALHLPNVKKSERTLLRRVERLIELLNLGDYRDKFVRELSTGTRRVVDLACVMAADPKVVLLDEPSSGVAQAETEELGPTLLRVKYETGCSMLVIEHDMPLIKAISDELMALDLGTFVTRGLPEEVTEHPQVVESYLGTDESAIMRSGQT